MNLKAIIVILLLFEGYDFFEKSFKIFDVDFIHTFFLSDFYRNF